MPKLVTLVDKPILIDLVKAYESSARYLFLR